MQALVRTLDQPEPVTIRSLLLKPSNRTCWNIQIYESTNLVLYVSNIDPYH